VLGASCRSGTTYEQKVTKTEQNAPEKGNTQLDVKIRAELQSCRRHFGPVQEELGAAKSTTAQNSPRKAVPLYHRVPTHPCASVHASNAHADPCTRMTRTNVALQEQASSENRGKNEART